MDLGRYIGAIIKQIRRDTDNEDYSGTNGIPDITFVEHFNDAQYRLQSLISAQYPQVFRRTKEMQIITNEDTYTINDNVLLGNRILSVEYTPTGDRRDYRALRQGTIHERNSDTAPEPSFYIHAHNSIILCPIPLAAIGKIRVTYEYSVLAVGTRVGRVTAYDGPPLHGVDYDQGTPDVQTINAGEYVSIVDMFGNVKASALPVIAPGTAADSGVLLFDNIHELSTGESITSGDYVVIGKYASTHNVFPREAEACLRKYVEAMILDNDESEKARKKLQQAEDMMGEVALLYADLSLDTNDVRITDYDSWV
jgi:hypothetical protein